MQLLLFQVVTHFGFSTNGGLHTLPGHVHPLDPTNTRVRFSGRFDPFNSILRMNIRIGDMQLGTQLPLSALSNILANSHTSLHLLDNYLEASFSHQKCIWKTIEQSQNLLQHGKISHDLTQDLGKTAVRSQP